MKLPPEQEAIQAKCLHPSGEFVEFAKDEIEQSIPERFAKIVSLYPNRVAIKERDYAVTYSELDEQSNLIAHAILERISQDNEPLAILVEHGAQALAAILAALKSGKIYLPLDPNYPPQRLKYMLADTSARLILTHQPTYSLAREIAGENSAVLNLDEVVGASNRAAVGLRISPSALACIFYTSGSTGQPKGVVDNHRNLLHGTLRFTNGLHLGSEDRLSFTHSCSSSASVRRIFPALLNGACLCPLDVRKVGSQGLLDLLSNESITMFSSGRIRDFVRNFSQDRAFPSLRLVSLGGEVVYRRDVELYRKVFPANCIIGIWMSSTETGNVTQFLIDNQTELKTEIVPIGYPAQDVEIFLHDDESNLVREGEVGEIVVKSDYLACGYWRRPELTKERFHQDGLQRVYRTGDLGRMEADGCLFHLGRKDDQFKVRGYRIEAAEIEAALQNLGYFSKVFVTLRDRLADEKVLVAYLEPRQWPPPSSSVLRRALAVNLPSHMIPSTFEMLEKLPLTPTGKVDRNALQELSSDRPNIGTEYVDPRTPTEGILAEIWGTVLSLDRIGVLDNFFDLGGHSLAATRVVSHVIRQFQIDVPLQWLFESPTIADMAAVIASHQGKALDTQRLNSMLAELEALSEDDALQALAETKAIK